MSGRLIEWIVWEPFSAVIGKDMISSARHLPLIAWAARPVPSSSQPLRVSELSQQAF
jgi:hypothetical protein